MPPLRGGVVEEPFCFTDIWSLPGPGKCWSLSLGKCPCNVSKLYCATLALPYSGYFLYLVFTIAKAMHEDLLLLIGQNIKSKRTEKKITLEELANRAGVTKGLISQIENN